GWNFEGGVKKLNTITDAGVTEADAEPYHVDNAYICNLSVGEALPKPTSGRTGMTFLGWRYSEDGELVTVDKMPAATDGNVYLYANWKSDSISQGGGGGGGEVDPPNPNAKEDGVYVGDTLIGKLVKNTGAASTGGLVAEYWFGGTKKALKKGDVVSIYMNNKAVSFYVDGSSAGIDKPADDKQVTSVKVTTAGDFAIYLKDYSSASKPNNWVCEFAGPTEINVGSQIPAGSSKIEVKWGTHSMTFYLTDSNGKGIGESDFSKCCIYTFNEEIFGKWAESTTKGVLKANMTSTVTSAVEGWIFRFDNFSKQTANITGLADNGTYIIQLPSADKGEAKVTKLEL
ncbi:MAG: hypothetical protein K2M48_05270, partial [Clostridiales bacterium]|nr:hypothetical protein [Clostridiales bacterium]